MDDLRNNIDHYMQLKGIATYSRLLIEIAHELGITGRKAYEFAAKEGSNFSKMLKGERPLKYTFIIPLEKIFGISLARLLYEDAYKLPVEKKNVPFNKGFRYYAYLDDPNLYKNEFDVLLTKDEKSILTRTDEFGKNFLDYVVEYHSVNGVRYLYEKYGIKLQWCDNQFGFTKDKGVTFIWFENQIEFARLVASMNDTELFNDIYDPYPLFFSQCYPPDFSIFLKDEFLEILLDNNKLFNSIFKTKPYVIKHKLEKDNTVSSVNPIINYCLRYALKHLDKYKHRAMAILKFGIDYNIKVAAEISTGDYYICNPMGGLRCYRDQDCYKLIIFADVDVQDEEVNRLIERLLKFKNNSF